MECPKFPDKQRFKKKKDAHTFIQSLAKRSTFTGEPFANALYRCDYCGDFHLYRRGKQQRPIRDQEVA